MASWKFMVALTTFCFLGTTSADFGVGGSAAVSNPFEVGGNAQRGDIPDPQLPPDLPFIDTIIVRNTGISVPFGRQHYVDPENELKMNVQPGHYCSVVVLEDPLSQVPGLLSPTSFPCDFGVNSLSYSHFGARKPQLDRVKLQLTYNTEDKTYIIPFMMEVRVESKQLEIVTTNIPLIVPDLRGMSEVIDNNKLEFSYDKDNENCFVTVLLSATGLPRYGEITSNIERGMPIRCDDFLTRSVAYIHTHADTSPSEDYIPMMVELSDLNGNSIKQEYFQMAVRISAGETNTPPESSPGSIMIMEVNQFVMTAITSLELGAEDDGTPFNDIVFNITGPFGEGEGYIVSTDDRNLPLSSFRQEDIASLKIAYVPPAEDSDEERVITINFEAIDSELAASESLLFHISVKAKNTLAPVVTRNTGLTLYEGQYRTFLTSQNLQISDEDNREDVIITPINGLVNGEIKVNGVSGQKFFTIQDLDAGVVTYHHDGSNTYSDNVIFRMTDGENEVEFLFPIYIIQEDDEPPVVNVNTGIMLNKGEYYPINPFILSATDVDSDDSSITFILEPPFSNEGRIVRRQSSPPENPQNWVYVGGIYEQSISEWKQKDIIEGSIFYHHIGGVSTNVVMDQTLFRVKDNNFRPNLSPVQTFVAKILPVDDEPPYLYPGTSLQMTVHEFELTEILKSQLRYTDLHTDDRELEYTITTQPYDVDLNNPLPAGEIVMFEDPSIVPIKFTQAMVNHKKIAYKPPSTELGIAPRMIEFAFAVQEPNNILSGQTFSILLLPVNNQPPVIKNTGATIFEGGSVVFSTAMLDVTDEDTDMSQIRFYVVDEPKHGTLTFDSVPLIKGDYFLYEDIVNGRITYINSGGEELGDTIGLEVTDGIHKMPITINIQVRPVDDQQPIINLPPGTLGSYVEVPEGSSSLITSNILSASDPDTEDLMLMFIISAQPKKGVIENGGLQVNSFTQQDVVNGFISYRHTSGEIGPTMASDSFNLTLSDMSDEFIHGGNRITQIEVYVTILPVDSVPPNVTFGEILFVDEAGKGQVTLNNILASDPDTNLDDITCMIVTVPTHGYIENISPAPGSEKSRVGMPISSFTIMDVRMGHINYVQSIHSSTEPEDDRFTYRCTDGINYSNNYFFVISITATNDEIPKMFIDQLQVVEGMDQVINVIRLNAEDDDQPPQQLHFYVVTPPKHGEIVLQGADSLVPISDFSLDQVKSGTVSYSHDDTETTKDSFELRLTDGDYDVFGTMPVTIFAMDDETPRLTINNGINIENRETKVITNRILKATDLDSIDANLTYTVRLEPSSGILQLLSPSGVAEQNLTTGSSFQQWQIDEGRIQYVHLGGVEENNIYKDLIKFDITDGSNPLIDRYFYVTINRMDNIHPVVVNKGLTLPEGGRMTLTTSLLSTSDINSPDEELTFIITRAPSRGHLENTDFPGVPITSFTQLDLAGNKIYYVHTSDEEVKMDSFQFEVTDGLNSVVRTFRISLSDVDNKKPVVTILPLTLNEGQNKLITPFELRIDDRDTSDERLVVTITQVPVQGNLLFNNSKIVTSFSMEDLNNNLISYQHDGTESTTDSFSFIISDGTHNEFYVNPQLDSTTRTPQRMLINIIPLDNGAPQMVVNRGGSTVGEVGPTGQLGFLITNKYLNSEDRDSQNGGLTYTITTQPKHGYIMNSAMGNVSIDSFTQDNVNNQFIQYIMNKGTNASSDIFFFSVTDAGGNTLSNQPFRLNWAWISLESEYYKVNETEGQLIVKLKRRGYLGETSFVGIETVDGQAIKGEDYHGKVGKQVQFNPGQTEGFMKIKIYDDNKYEETEVFSVRLHDPVMGALEFPEIALVNILDPEDESTVYIDIPPTFSVTEDAGEVLVAIRRTGDLTDEMMVMCSTISDTATGSEPSPVTSFSDYISRVADDNANFVMFESGEALAFCRIRIIDDSLYEDAEIFQVKLSNTMGGRIGSPAVMNVEIEADTNDEPSFYFGQQEYMIDESGGYVEVDVWRTGTDLTKMASVTVRSHKSDPVSAVAGEDYNGISTNLDFAPGVTKQTVKINVLDDIGQPVLEGLETFRLVLRMPMNAVLGGPNHVNIIINDTVSDLPKVSFRAGSYTVNENDGSATAMVVRTGDITQPSSVRCYSRQGSAQVMMDYDERPNTDVSVINFEAGESEKPCTILLMNDNLYEEKEKFRLVLDHARTNNNLPGLVGDQSETLIYITDDGDKPVIKFKETRYNADEPTDEDEEVSVKITVVRLGDTSKTSIVRVYTKDGSAKSGYDYDAFSKRLVFGFNVSEIPVDVDILYDSDRNEMREAFTVLLTPDQNNIAELGDSKAIVYIDQTGGNVAGITFPAPPVVVSLLNYDDATNGIVEPVPGYPVVCVTPCNPKHPDFAVTGSICTTEGVNDTMTQFRWMVAAPSAANGATSPLREVSSNTFFTSTNQLTLDSIYFAPGSRVQCSARAVSNLGDPGREYMSDPVIISKSEGLCMPRTPGAVGADPFTAKLRYTGPADPDHPNMIKLTVTMPHTDGMLPVISTRQLSNFELTLSEDGLRVGTHQCSNLLDFDEVRTNYGFITKDTKNPNVVGETKDYQFSSDMRTDRTLRFYRNLDMDSCLWEFTNYYTMSELLDRCGGQIGTDGQVLDLVQSYVSLDVPLYVSYIFHSPVGIGGWQHFDLQSNLRLTFVYDTSILWENGIGTSRSDLSSLQGYLYPTSMRIEKNGRLVVDFRTEARFRGQFVLAHPNTDIESNVFSADHPGVTYDLDLIRSEPTFAEPEQLWQFTSSVALSDYSGAYTVRLVPCSTPVGATYSEPIVCNPNDPIEFQIPIRFQQVSDPVPAEFSLNSEFVLMNKESLWLSDGSMGFGEGSDTAFAPGDTIFGRIHVDPVQNLGDGFFLNIEKVFLCSGLDGYIPKYNPTNDEYGCVADTPNLLYSYKILDRAAPTTVVSDMGGITFNASLAIDDRNAAALAQMPNADGFSMGTRALFEASAGRQNFLHAIYTIRSSENAGRGIGKRSIEYHSIGNANQNSLRKRRKVEAADVQELSSIGNDGLGTNIHRIAMSQKGGSRILTYDNNDIGSNYEKGANNIAPTNSIMPVIIGVVGAAIILCLVLIIVLVLRRKKASPVAAPTTVYQNGSAKVVASSGNDDDNTEV
ncbi:extracellular matrix protein 3-like [Antedon mediterranea]|uniref:extracellular matrix protein 3-like n=1 Tax=Antedon mediterranea TaxID=105859 RepID=UPI003AF4843B